MFTKLQLTAKFNRAAAAFPAAMAELTRAATGPEGEDFLNRIPVCDPDIWGEGSRGMYDFNNCTNFALNRNTCDRLQPGETGPKNGGSVIPDIINNFGDFVRDVRKNALHDGLIPLGHGLTRAFTTGIPVALFFSDRISQSGLHLSRDHKYRFDYHWFALRRDAATGDLLWAHKLAHLRAEDCQKFDGNIFEAALHAGDICYDGFAGYYAVPQKILYSSKAPPSLIKT